MYDSKQPADESLQKLMDRFILFGLIVAALAVVLLVVLGTA
jgi:hypothetical protein